MLVTKKTTEKEMWAKDNSHGPNPCPRPETSAACWHRGPRQLGAGLPRIGRCQTPVKGQARAQLSGRMGFQGSRRRSGCTQHPACLVLRATSIPGCSKVVLRLKNKEPPGDQRFFRRHTQQIAFYFTLIKKYINTCQGIFFS